MTDTPSPAPSPLASSQFEAPALPEVSGAAPGKVLSQAAIRALQEADARRAAEPPPSLDGAPDEIGGPAGPDPTRFGDWERKGLTIDF